MATRSSTLVSSNGSRYVEKSHRAISGVDPKSRGRGAGDPGAETSAATPSSTPSATVTANAAPRTP
jgi:hypothetical protein